MESGGPLLSGDREACAHSHTHVGLDHPSPPPFTYGCTDPFLRPPTAYSIELSGSVVARNSASGNVRTLSGDDALSLCLPSFADFALWRWAVRRRLGLIYHGLADDQLEAPELCVPFVSTLKDLEKVRRVCDRGPPLSRVPPPPAQPHLAPPLAPRPCPPLPTPAPSLGCHCGPCATCGFAPNAQLAARNVTIARAFMRGVGPWDGSTVASRTSRASSFSSLPSSASAGGLEDEDAGSVVVTDDHDEGEPPFDASGALGWGVCVCGRVPSILPFARPLVSPRPPRCGLCGHELGWFHP
jgi:hypothetical protein